MQLLHQTHATKEKHTQVPSCPCSNWQFNTERKLVYHISTLIIMQKKQKEDISKHAWSSDVRCQGGAGWACRIRADETTRWGRSQMMSEEGHEGGGGWHEGHIGRLIRPLCPPMLVPPNALHHCEWLALWCKTQLNALHCRRGGSHETGRAKYCDRLMSQSYLPWRGRQFTTAGVKSPTDPSFQNSIPNIGRV